MFASLFTVSFVFSTLLSIKAPSDIGVFDDRCPMAVAIHATETDDSPMTRFNSVNSNFTVGSQPVASQGDEIGTPCAEEEKLCMPHHGARTEPLDEVVVRALYKSVLSQSAACSASKMALVEMATRDVCSAKLAIAILYKVQKESFDMTEADASKNIDEAFPVLLSYQTINPAIFNHWNDLLMLYGLRCG